MLAPLIQNDKNHWGVQMIYPECKVLFDLI